MSCCGSKSTTSQPQQQSSSARPSQSHAGAAPASGMHSVQIAYSGNSVLHVTGPYSGLHYTFSSAAPVATVDARDAMTMLAIPGLRPHSFR